MNRGHLGLAVIALLSLIAGALLFNLWQPELSTDRPARQDITISLDKIPLYDLDNQQTEIGDWKGRILVINFWAPWCAPCRREIPGLINLHREFSAQEVSVLGIAFDSLAPVLSFAEEYQMNYPQYLAENRISMYNAAFGNHSGSLPFTAVLDRDLNITFQHNGEVTEQQLRVQIEALL